MSRDSRISVFGQTLAFVILLALTLVVTGSSALAQVSKVFVVPLSHLDIGFTASPPEVADQHREYTERALQFLVNVPSIRWNVESVWQLEQWLATHPAESDRSLLKHLFEQGQLGIGASYANMHSSLMTGEEMLRMFYPAARIEQELGVDLDTAVMNDVPGFAWYMPQALASSGVRYLLTGVNLAFGGGTSIPVAQTPFYWVGPDGSRVLTWISREGYLEGIFYWGLGKGSYTELVEKIRDLEKSGYPYDAILIIDGTGDNAPPDTVVLRDILLRQWQSSNREVEVKLSTVQEFFRYMEEKYGAQFPEYRGDWGRTWEVTRTAGPWQMAQLRWAQSQVTGAETLALLASRLAGVTYPEQALSEAWRNILLMDEHTGGPGTGWPDLTTKAQVEAENEAKARYALDARRLLTDVMKTSLSAIGHVVGGDGLHRPGQVEVLVYNQLSWPRNAEVTIPREALQSVLPDSSASGSPLHLRVVDLTTGAQVASWSDEAGNLVFATEPLSPLGFHRYAVDIIGESANASPDAGIPATPAPASDASLGLESTWYRLEISPFTGQILTLFDKQLGKDLRNAKSTYGFNQLVVAPHATAFIGGKPVAITPRVDAVARADHSGSVGLIVRYAPGTPWVRSEIRLSLTKKQIEITNVLDRTAMRYVPYAQHSDHYYFAFPFDLPPTDLKVRYLGATCFQSISDDLLPGANAANIISRAAIDLRSSQWGVTVAHREAFSFTVGGISHIGSTFLPLEATLFSHVVEKADEGRTKDVGIASFDVEPAAPDQLVFSYAFTSNGDQFDPISAYRFGLEWVTPVAAVLLSPTVSSSLPNTLDIWPKAGVPDSLVSVDKPNVVVSAFKQAEFGDRNDIILRLQEIAGEPSTVSVQTAIPITAAYRANAVESPTEELPSIHPLQVSIKPYETITIRLIPDAVFQRRNEKNIQPR